MLDSSERKVLVTCLFISSCICFLPGEWVTGSAMLVLTLVAYTMHRRITAREPAANAPEDGAGRPPDGNDEPSRSA